jgi:hypothetical protein
VNRPFNILFLLFVLLFVLVPVVAAQDVPGSPPTTERAGAVLAIALGVNRFVEFLKPRVRATKFSEQVQDSLLILIALVAGVAATFMANGAANLFPDTAVRYPIFALVLTGIVAGFGAEFVHILVDVLYAGRDWVKPAIYSVERSDTTTTVIKDNSEGAEVAVAPTALRRTPVPEIDVSATRRYGQHDDPKIFEDFT